LPRQIAEFNELVRSYGPAAVAQAIDKAAAAHAFGSDYIANILGQQSSPRPVEPPVRLKDPRLNELATDRLSLLEYGSSTALAPVDGAEDSTVLRFRVPRPDLVSPCSRTPTPTRARRRSNKPLVQRRNGHPGALSHRRSQFPLLNKQHNPDEPDSGRNARRLPADG